MLWLTASAGGPRFARPPALDAVSAAGLSPREADVLVLLLDGLTTPAIGDRLGVAGSTVRTHCRAVLRKLGAGDRRALRALLLAGPAAGSEPVLVAPALRFVEAGVPALPRNRRVESPSTGAHT